MTLAATEPPRDCPLCPRLVALREAVRAEHPDWWNAPCPALGDEAARIALVGLAPGKHGAHRTGRAFTGDDAGTLLFATLSAKGLVRGTYAARPDDGVALAGVAIVNAAKCLPPQNRPTPAEVSNCRQFLVAQLAVLTDLRVIVPLGRIAHDAALRALGLVPAHYAFGHGVEHRLPDGRWLLPSYHPSRYNQNTGRLTAAMFEAVIGRARLLAGL